MKEELAVRRVAPAHCTGMLAPQIFREVYGKDFVSAGLGSQVPFTLEIRRFGVALLRTIPESRAPSGSAAPGYGIEDQIRPILAAFHMNL